MSFSFRLQKKKVFFSLEGFSFCAQIIRVCEYEMEFTSFSGGGIFNIVLLCARHFLLVMAVILGIYDFP